MFGRFSSTKKKKVTICMDKKQNLKLFRASSKENNVKELGGKYVFHCCRMLLTNFS
jgi:hypothetical protein